MAEQKAEQRRMVEGLIAREKIGTKDNVLYEDALEDAAITCVTFSLGLMGDDHCLFNTVKKQQMQHLRVGLNMRA